MYLDTVKSGVAITIFQQLFSSLAFFGVCVCNTFVFPCAILLILFPYYFHIIYYFHVHVHIRTEHANEKNIDNCIMHIYIRYTYDFLWE